MKLSIIIVNFNTFTFLDKCLKSLSPKRSSIKNLEIIVVDNCSTDESVKLIKKIQPDIVNLSKFCPRPKTEASKLEQLPKEIINERSRILHRLINEIKIKKNEKWIGWQGEVLVDETGRNNSFIARNFAYKPIVIKSDRNLLGKFVEVEVVDARSNYLIGKLI